MAESTTSKTMNSLISGTLRQRRDASMERFGGVLGRLQGQTLDEDRQERLNAAMARVESAIKHGSTEDRQTAEAHLDAVLNDREVSTPAEPPRGGVGGVRRPVTRREPPSMNKVIRQTVAERRAISAWARGD